MSPRLSSTFWAALIGFAVSAFGDGIYLISINWWVITRTESAQSLGLVAAVGALVFIVAAPYGGRWLDRFGPIRLIIIADIWRVLVLLAFLALSLLGADQAGLAFFIPLVVLMTLGTSISSPGIFTLIPLIVVQGDVRRANSTLITARSIATFAGPAVAGITLGFAGVGWAILINAGTFLFSAIVLVSIRRGIPKLTQGSRTVDPSSHQRWSTVRALVGNGAVTFAFIVALLGNFALAMYSVSLPFKFGLDSDSGNPSAEYGFTQAAFQAGMVAAGVLLGMRRSGRLRTTSLAVAIGLVGMGIGVAAVGVADLMSVILPGALLLGMSLMFVSVLSDTQLQVAVSPDLRGRVQGLVQGLGSGLRPLGILVATATFGLAGATPAFLCASALLGLVALACILLNAYRDAVQPRAPGSAES